MYILDTNIFINFYERAYWFNLFPKFWDTFLPILNNKVALLDVVKNEAKNNKDFETWINKNFTGQNIKTTDSLYTDAWKEVTEFIVNSNYYPQKAITSDRSWLNRDIADGWIIAVAMVKNYTIVTKELGLSQFKDTDLSQPKPNNLTISNKCSPKIPDVARHFGIRCINQRQFFEEVKFQL